MTSVIYAPAMQLNGKRVLVIGGGGGGIGRATTDAFGNEGAAVLVADLDPQRAAEAADAVRAAGGTAYPIATAVANAVVAADVVEEIPVGRFGRSEEVARAVVYLASDAASYITGQQLVLDGGVSVRGPFE